MTASQGNLAGLSRYIFRAPRWYSSLSFVLVVAGLTGVGVFDNHFLLDDITQGVFFIGVPTIVAGVMTSWLDRALGGQLTPNRSSLLALTSELLVVAIVVLAGTVSLVTALDQNFVFDALLVALASTLALRLVVVMAVSRHSLPVALVPASVQTLAASAILFVYSGTMRFLSVQGPILEAYLSRSDKAPPEFQVIVPGDFVNLGIVCGIYVLAVYTFVRVIDRPWQRTLDISVLEFLSGFIGHIAEGTRELEDLFERIGEDAVVPVTVLSFRTEDGDEKAQFLLPMIHPGPMGEIGGGNLPIRVAEEAEGLAFPPHATAGHDFNLVTEREVDVVLDAAERARESIEFGDTATPGVRVASGEATLLGQAFGDDLVLVSTFAPGCADDVEYAVGLSAAAEARSGGFDDVLLVDAHNCNDGLTGEDLGHVVPGSTRSFDMMQAAGAAADRLESTPQDGLRLGTAWDPTPWTPRDGIGPLGVRVAVLEAGGRRTAYVLVDGNNMDPGVRDHILERVTGDADDESAGDGTVDVAEVMTTDTHVVNRVESENQVGSSISVVALADLVERLVEEAVDDLEPVEAGMGSERASVTVFGNDRTETLASHANAMVSMGGALALAVTLAAMTLSVLVFVFR